MEKYEVLYELMDQMSEQLEKLRRREEKMASELKRLKTAMKRHREEVSVMQVSSLFIGNIEF